VLCDYLTPKTTLFADDVTQWRDAVERVAAPLLDNGAITRDYVAAMIDSIAAGGTYIDLGFGIALAHSRPEDGVVATGLSSLRVRPSVLLNDDPLHPIDLFICLAAVDNQGHLGTLMELARLLIDGERRTRLLAARTTAEISAVIQGSATPE
jgi:PTS system ascorbate-specific IIA component